jgi:hypothetical protein
MSVRIGHASIDENGKASGGSAGDQNGREVCTRDWYNKPWDVLLRPVNQSLAEKSAVACEQACANSKIGYDQGQRNSLYIEAIKVNYNLANIKTACECDCSSLMCVCAIAGGVSASLLYKGGNMQTTRSMRNAFKATGLYEVITDSKYLTSDQYLKRGDILVKEGSHTVMVLSNGSAVSKPVEPPKPDNNGNQSYCGKGIGTGTALTTMNVRDTNGTAGKVVGTVAKGAKVEVLEILSNGWYKIVWPGCSKGYAYTSNASNKYYTYVANSNSYKVKITASALNVRAGVGTSYKINKVVHQNEVYTVVEEKSGWGRLSTGDGWISLSYTKRV